MTKKNMIHALSEKTGMSLKQSEVAFTAVVEIITEEIATEKKASVSGLGTFEVRSRSARKGRNFRTGESVKIPKSNSVGFRSGKNLKDIVNKD
jgi:DNA-binding protein HU-beta